MADQILINDSRTNPLSSVQFAVGYVANIPALWMHFVVTGGKGRIQFGWFADAAFTQLIGTTQLDEGGTGGIINRTFRPLAPYLRVTMIPQAGGVASTTLLLTTTADITMPTLQNVYVNDLGRFQQPIGATSTDTFTSQQARTGLVYWMASCTAASWTARLQTVDFNGNTSTVDCCDNTFGAGQSRGCYLGGGNPQIVIVNNDAAAKTYNAFLNWATDISR